LALNAHPQCPPLVTLRMVTQGVWLPRVRGPLLSKDFVVFDLRIAVTGRPVLVKSFDSKDNRIRRTDRGKDKGD